MKMDNTELAAWINNAAVKYECDLDDGVSERTAADNFINNVLNILVKAGINGQIEPADYYEYETKTIPIKTIPIKHFKLSAPAGNDIIASNNDEIHFYTE
jgi:hypothetical protein